MSIYIGNTKYKEIYLGSNKISEVYLGSNKIFAGSSPGPGPDPYNPLGLPANTVRVRTNNGKTPVKGSKATYETATLVTGTSDVYDVYKSGTSFDHFLYQSTNIVEVLGANTTGITDMNYMFYGCNRLTTVPLFDTSSVTIMEYMFYSCGRLTAVPLFNTSSVTTMRYTFNGCASLTSVPLLNTSSVTNMSYSFRDCPMVESGALALYQQASTQTNPPTSYTRCFRDCGSSTTTGAAELAQIPSGWK